MDSNITTPIHNKHQQHKTIQQMIKPQVPPEIKPPKNKFVDKEGLCKRIPIENIAGIATTIASGGLGGAGIAAGEALLTGGITGLLGAGEAIGGAAIGGAVGTGVNSAIGGGEIGRIVSGIAGGLAGRATAGRTTRTRGRGNRLGGRQTNARNIDGQSVPVHHDESEPLIRGGGRLGGRNRNEISTITHDPNTGETTTWTIPPEEQNTMLNRVRKAAQKTMENINDTVHNIRQQITGRNKNPSKGTYARIPTNEENVAASKLQASLKRSNTQDKYEFDKFLKKENVNAVNDSIYEDYHNRGVYGDDEFDIENVLKTMKKEGAANTLKAALKRKKEENTIAFTKMTNENEQLLQQQKQKDAANFILSKIKQKKIEPERHKLQQYVKNRINKESAANTLKAALKRKKAEKILTDVLHEEQDNAGSTIKNVLRGHKGRQYHKYLRDEYPAIEARRREQVSTMQSSTALQTEPIQLRVPQNVIESRARARELHEQAVRQRTQELYEIQNQQPSTQLQTLTRKQQQYKNLITSGNIETAANQRLERIQNQTNQAQQITNAIKAIKTKNDAAVKIQSAVRNKSAFNQLEEAKTIKELKQKINRAFNNTKREIAAENTIKNAAKRKAINQLELRKGITKTQNRISELDTRTPNKMHLAFSKKGVVKSRHK